MSKAATLTNHEARYKALAQSYLAEARRALRQLAAERQREERRRVERPSLVTEVKAILRGA
jgi:thermostable 8-oxoguanine DNA glycosylase